MKMSKSRYVCQSCGSVYSKWLGKCDACGEWNTIQEELGRDAVPISGKKKKSNRNSKRIDFVDLNGVSADVVRLQSNISELDRVCGGGMVPGSAILIGGDPGIGKSTILLQAAAKLSQTVDVAYISGEEAIDQIRMRAKRLGVAEASVHLASATHLGDILETLDINDPPKVVIIDSIQTVYTDAIESAPGTVSQVRTCASELVRVAKKRNITMILVGHVTKEGAIAGPRVLEHMVDAVLYFEGERGHQFRILRSVKNRFGATNEIGVFEMTELGLQEVLNPSALFLGNQDKDVSGAAVYAGMEGTRPILAEIQALVSPSTYPTPKRTVIGWDAGRLSMIVAVLEARCGVMFTGKDIYLNVAGGFRVTETAADLAVAAALISSLMDLSLPKGCIFFGEIGLSGEVRSVGHSDLRLKEAGKLGFEKAVCPKISTKKVARDNVVAVSEIGYTLDLLRFCKKS
ncbi:MAG: DNA repair protein RadA [Alphaproteobacteria bacterium]